MPGTLSYFAPLTSGFCSCAQESKSYYDRLRDGWPHALRLACARRVQLKPRNGARSPVWERRIAHREASVVWPPQASHSTTAYHAFLVQSWHSRGGLQRDPARAVLVSRPPLTEGPLMNHARNWQASFLDATVHSRGKRTLRGTRSDGMTRSA